MIDKVINKVLFVLYAVMMLAVTVSCVHKEAASDLAEQDRTEVEEEMQCVEFFGISLRGKNVVSIVKEMEERVKVLSLHSSLPRNPLGKERQFSPLIHVALAINLFNVLEPAISLKPNDFM